MIREEEVKNKARFYLNKSKLLSSPGMMLVFVEKTF